MRLTTGRNVFSVKKGKKVAKKRSHAQRLKAWFEQASSSLNSLKGTSTSTEFTNRISKELQQGNHQSISDLFTAKNACYHHICILDQRHKLKIVTDQSPQDSGSGDNLRSNKQRSGDLLGELKCLFCNKIDTQENLIEASIKYATKKKVNVSHVHQMARHGISPR